MTRLALPAENVTRSPRQAHMEVMNPATGDVWLLQDPISIEEFTSLRVEPPWVKVGFTTASMDSAGFRRSPGADADGPVETREIGGRRFARVAKVRKFGGFAAGAVPTRIEVEKHHLVGFDAGRTITVARLPDGQFYVEQTECMPGKSFEPPADWQMFTLRLTEPWSLQIACPVSVYFFRSLRSFQGPVAPEWLPGRPVAATEPRS